MKEQKSYEQSLHTLSATESRESPWRYKKILHIFALSTVFWLFLLKFLVLSFCQKRSCTIKVTYCSPTHQK